MSRPKDTGEQKMQKCFCVVDILGGNQMPHFLEKRLSGRLSPSLPMAFCGAMLSLLSTSPLQALPNDEGMDGGTTLQQTGGGEAATPALPSPREGVRRCTYEGRVRDAMASPGSRMRYASGRELASFLRGTKAEIEEIESLATTLPTGTFAKPLSDVFADLVGFVCQQMVPLLIQSAQENTQAFLQGNGTEVWSTVKSQSCPVVFHISRYDEKDWDAVRHDSFNPFTHLWPVLPAPLTDGVHQKTAVQDPGAGKGIQTILDKYAEALPLIDEAERDKRIQSQEWRVEGAKESLAITQRWLDSAVREALGIFSSVPLNSEGRPMTTYEEVIDLFGGHMGPDRCSDTVLSSNKMRAPQVPGYRDTRVSKGC